jgi:hypothetical protein
MQDAYFVDNMASQRTLRPKRKGNWRKLQFGEDIPTDKPRLARTSFPETFEVERLISKKSVNNEVILFSFFLNTDNFIAQIAVNNSLGIHFFSYSMTVVSF